MSKLKELIEKRGKVAADLAELLKKDQTPEIRTQADTMITETETLTADIQRIERADKIAREMAVAAPVDGTQGERSEEEKKKASKEYRAAWRNFLEAGDPHTSKALIGNGMSAQSREILENARRTLANGSLTQEQRDQIAGTQSISYTQGAAGGFFVPAGFVYDVEVATKYYAPLLDGSTIRIMETATGQPLPYPTSNDTNQAWQLIGEGAQVNDNGSNSNASYSASGVLTVSQTGSPLTQAGNVLLSNVTFGAYKGSTGHVRVSLELLQDSAFNIEQFLANAFAVRLGRGYEFYLTQGNGTTQPQGIIPAIAASGAVTVTAAGSSANDGSSNTGANSIGYNDLVNLEHSVDPTYRRNAKFMMHDNTVRFLKTLLDKFGRPLWVPSMKEGQPDTILNYPYVVNQSMDTIAASKVTVAFGAWDKFICRKVRDLQVLRLDERFADLGLVSYVGFSRLDSKLLDAGSHPLNTITQHS